MSVILGDRYLGPGERGPTAAPIDLDRLLVSRLLVQANSGGGKSWALRRLLEQTFHLVPHVVLDVDDEFHTLREKYPYVLAGAAGGDCRADPRTAPLLARRVLEHGFSLIVGIYELKKHERMRFVRLFLEALIDAPRTLWRPLLVVVDEAHLFCPEKEQAESAAAVIDLMTRGRKRGFCGVLATQRISKLNKDAAAEANNKLIGRSALDVDMKRAADELGFTSREEQHRLRALEAGEFFAFGPALSREVTLVKVGAVETTHPEPGSRRAVAPPPAPEKLKAILAKLADLPKDAEAEAGEMDRLRREVAELRARSAQATPTAAALAAAAHEGFSKGRAQGWSEGHAQARADAAQIGRKLEDLVAELRRFSEELPATRRFLAGQRVSLRTAPEKTTDTDAQGRAAATEAAAPRTPRRLGAEPSPVSGPLQRVLDALAELEVLGVREAEREQVAFLAGYTNTTSKGFANAMGSGRTAGLLEYPAPGRLTLTEAGRAQASFPARPRTPAELQHRVLDLLPGVHARVLEPLIRVYPNGFQRGELARIAGYGNTTSKGFANALGRLRSLGFVDYPQPGTVKATPVLFLERR